MMSHASLPDASEAPCGAVGVFVSLGCPTWMRQSGSDDGTCVIGPRTPCDNVVTV
jgi:hypothetical protein